MDFPKVLMGILRNPHSQFTVYLHTPPFWTLAKLGLAGLCVAAVPAVHIPVR